MSLRFRYRAATPAGQIVEGVLHAASRPVALDDLRRQRLYPVSVDEALLGRRAGPGSRLGLRPAVALWTRTAATLLSAGMPLDRMLRFTAAHVEHEALADALQQVRRDVQGGTSFADALARHPRCFDSLFVALASAGESTGALDAAFDRLSGHLEEAAELRSQVRSALMYPALMSVVACVGMVVLLGFVLPRFATVLTDIGGSLPWTTRALLGTSRLVAAGWWAWLLMGGAAAYAIRRSLGRPETRRRWDGMRLGWPVVGDLELKYATARFTRTLALLLKSGVPALPALRLARASAPNVVVREGIDRAAAALAQGSALAPAFAETLPPLALQMIAVGEESSRLEELCTRVADTYDGEVRRALRTAVAMLEPALILVFGALVGFVALAMLQAIYGINLRSF